VDGKTPGPSLSLIRAGRVVLVARGATHTTGRRATGRVPTMCAILAVPETKPKLGGPTRSGLVWQLCRRLRTVAPVGAGARTVVHAVELESATVRIVMMSWRAPLKIRREMGGVCAAVEGSRPEFGGTWSSLRKHVEASRRRGSMLTTGAG